MDIQNVGSLLAQLVNDPSTYEQAQRVYSGVYRSEPVTFGSLDADYAVEIISDILEEKAFSVWEQHECLENHFDPFTAFQSDYVRPDIDLEKWEQVEFCYLCNYKGESEGLEYALLMEVKHLPVFRSKYNYDYD